MLEREKVNVECLNHCKWYNKISTCFVVWWRALNVSLDILKVSFLKNWCLDRYF